MKFCTEKKIEYGQYSGIKSLKISYSKYFTHFGQIWVQNLRNSIIKSKLVHSEN